MNRMQRLVKFLAPKSLFARMEAESKAWFLECPCGWSISVWDAGGIRFKATTTKKKTLGKCPACEKMQWFSFKRME